MLATSAVALTPTEASAQWRHRGHGWGGGGIAAGVVGGLALGALASGAAGGYGPYHGAYDYGYGGCYLTNQRVWDGYGWRIQRVRVCE